MLEIRTDTFKDAESSLPSPAASETQSPPPKEYEAEKEYDVSSLSVSDEDDVVHPYVANRAGSVRKCNYCGVTSTPMWRHGPGNYANLCNSCGVKWRRGKILATGDNRHHLCRSDSPRKQTKSPKAKSKTERLPPVKVAKRKFCESTPDRTASNSPSSVRSFVFSPSRITSNSDKCSSTSVGTLTNQYIRPSPVKEPKTLATLTSEFADLLEMLPVNKTAEFTSVLAKCFQPKVSEAYAKGIEVEMSVLDVTPETWDILRAIVTPTLSH